MSVLRGCDTFEKLWDRREVVSSRELGRIHLLSLPDLVTAKKTQRDKDWPMIRRLVEADYFRNRSSPKARKVDVWLHELRTPELLVELVRRRPARARRLAATAHFSGPRQPAILCAWKTPCCGNKKRSGRPTESTGHPFARNWNCCVALRHPKPFAGNANQRAPTCPDSQDSAGTTRILALWSYAPNALHVGK